MAQIDFTASERRTKRLVSVENIGKELGGRTLFRELSFTLTPGARLDLVLGWQRSGILTCAVSFALAAPRSLSPGLYSGTVNLTLATR